MSRRSWLIGWGLISMPEAIKLNFPKSNVLSDKYRSVLMIEEMKKIMKCGNLGHFPSCKFCTKLQLSAAFLLPKMRYIPKKHTEESIMLRIWFIRLLRL